MQQQDSLQMKSISALFCHANNHWLALFLNVYLWCKPKWKNQCPSTEGASVSLCNHSKGAALVPYHSHAALVKLKRHIPRNVSQKRKPFQRSFTRTEVMKLLTNSSYILLIGSENLLGYWLVCFIRKQKVNIKTLIPPKFTVKVTSIFLICDFFEWDHRINPYFL